MEVIEWWLINIGLHATLLSLQYQTWLYTLTQVWQVTLLLMEKQLIYSFWKSTGTQYINILKLKAIGIGIQTILFKEVSSPCEYVTIPLPWVI